MRPLSIDTDPEAERVQLDLLRRAGPDRRLALALSLSQTTLALARDALRRRYPEATERELALRFVATHYGEALARDLEAFLASRDGITDARP